MTTLSLSTKLESATSTPPATLSRASTVSPDSNGREAQTTSSISDPKASDIDQSAPIQPETQGMTTLKQNTIVFEPHKMLMETTVSIECGHDPSNTLTIHEELLRCYSKPFDDLCTTAKPLREKYAQSKMMRDQVAGFVFPEMSPRKFEEESSEKKAIPVAMHIYEKYPMTEQRPVIKKIIDTAIEEQTTRKNTKAPQSGTGNSRKRDHRDANRDLNIKERLSLLNSRGMQGVMDMLFTKLHMIQKSENSKANSDVVRATAQRRIILPGIEEKIVHSFIQWIYHGTIHCQDAKELYALLNLSNQLGTQALTEVCLTKLHNATCESIQRALDNGVSIQSLLGSGSESTDNILEVVFINVFRDKKPPERLLRLVIDTLANSLDMDLWGQLKDLIGHEMALQLIEAMIIRQQAGTEINARSTIKEEGDVNVTNR